ncbi:MAG: cysteine desulfurase [Alicyclobacillus sp.]|nr:cysteine desulfurase [Alicyclobacillus sp.]
MNSGDLRRIVYLDNAATTPCDPRVVEAMKPYWIEMYGNPSSPHVMGQFAHQTIEDCREKILSLLRGSGELLFTSGSTESNNLGIYSLLRYSRERLGRKKVLCLSTEHKSIINAVTYFGKNMNMTVEWIPVDYSGSIDLDWFKAAMNTTVGAVVVQLANSETGVIQDLKTISAISHEFGARCFSDMTQAIGKINIDLDALGIDYGSFTAHKFYGPKGVGALYIAPGLPVSPLVFGGGQEKGGRPGTENVPGIVGLATALKISVDELQQNSIHMIGLRDRMWARLDEVGDIRWNGRQAPLLPSHLNITISNVNAQDLLLRVRKVAFSAGSACNTASNAPSPVLLAMGMTQTEAEQTIRLSVGRFNTTEDIETACLMLRETIQAIRLEA